MPLEAADITGIAQALKDLGAPGIQAASLKLPEFWTDKPEVLSLSSAPSKSQ